MYEWIRRHAHRQRSRRHDHESCQIYTETQVLGEPVRPELDNPIVVLVAGAWHAGWAWEQSCRQPDSVRVAK